MEIENAKLSIKTVVGAIAVTWAAGTGVAVWAANQEGRLDVLEKAQAAGKASRKELSETTEELADVVNKLNTSILLLDQKLEWERQQRERRAMMDAATADDG